MGEMASLWGYEENHELEQLGQKLLFTTLELEKLKAETRDEMKKNKEYVKQLIQLLKIAIQDRDEARNQLNKLLHNNIGQNFPSTPQHFQPQKANSSITESNSLSETHNYQSPVDSLFDAAATSPEFTNINLVVNQSQNQPLVESMVPKIDKGDLIIDNLAKGRALPQKGKLLQAVLESGPLLGTLLVAGPLPRWRNPPQLQTFQIPPVSIKGCDSEQKPPQTYAQIMSRGSAQVRTEQPTLSSYPNNVALGTSCGNGTMVSSEIVNDHGCYRFAKRQRFC